MAVLCDAASARDGLLSVLSGGVTQVRHASYPATLSVAVGLMLELPSGEVNGEHEVDVRLVGEALDEPQTIATVKFTGELSDDSDPESPFMAPLALPLHGIPLERAGRYSLAIFYNNEQVASLALEATHPATESRDQSPGAEPDASTSDSES